MAAPVDPNEIERARKGDAAAFEALVEARVGPMTRTAMAILGREADALDAVQDALVIAWRELASLRDPAAFDAWLTRILVNRCKRGLRRVVRQRVREIPADQVAAAADPAAPDARVDGVGQREILERAFERLTVDERTILVLHHLDGRPLAEIAAVLKVPVGTAKSRLFAARRSLDRALEREGGQ
jgi:RNA polymerase sigma factor (sigma-70 family)